jgi:hypothetical protein
VRAVVF